MTSGYLWGYYKQERNDDANENDEVNYSKYSNLSVRKIIENA